jgi:hypothetical protein
MSIVFEPWLCFRVLAVGLAFRLLVLFRAAAIDLAAIEQRALCFIAHDAIGRGNFLEAGLSGFVAGM